MQPKDKVNQLRASIQAKKENEARLAASRGQGELSPGLEDQYRTKIADLEELLEKSEAARTEAEKKARESQDQYIRLYADLENFKKRVAKEKEDLVKYGQEKIIKELLPILDGLEKALEHAIEAPDKEAIVGGVQLVLKQFLQAMEKFGVSPVEAVGQPFDPNFHEAMGHHESDEHEPDTVVNQYRTGYMFQDRLLRPALVTVAKPPEEKK